MAAPPPRRSPPVLKPRGSVFNARTVTAPIAAIVMAGLLYTYSVTSIRAAKRNAKLHREADGGQLDMRRESLRRHGVLEKVEGTTGVALFWDSRKEDRAEKELMGANTAKMPGESPRGVKEEVLGAATGPRTEVEGRLEDYKGRGNAVKKFQQEKPILEEPERETR